MSNWISINQFVLKMLPQFTVNKKWASTKNRGGDAGKCKESGNRLGGPPPKVQKNISNSPSQLKKKTMVI